MSQEQMDALSAYAMTLGLAYQITDDLLAFTEDEKALGRPTDSDRTKEKQTHPVIAGAEGSRGRVVSLVGEALAACRSLGEKADALQAIARFVEERVSR